MRISIILVFGLMFAQPIQAQDVQQAFSQSYAAELRGDYHTAIASIQATKDNGYHSRLRLAYLFYTTGMQAEAMQQYEQASKLRPFAIEPKLGYAKAAAALNNWAQVQAQYEAILKIDPNQTYISYQLGMIHYNKAEYAKALRLFERVVNLYPADYDGLIMYAWTHYRMGKLKEAKVLFQTALLSRPGDNSALEGLSLIK
ncbi:MAG: tetratricopeptide repeat protein [Bacteroidia bacterium]